VFNNVSTTALCDTGSQVTTVSHVWLNKYFPNIHITPIELKLTAVNGLDIPYVGFVTVSLQIFGQVISQVPVLVLKSDGNKIPVLIGINVLSQIDAKSSRVPVSVRAVLSKCSFVNERNERVAKTVCPLHIPTFPLREGAHYTLGRISPLHPGMS
jgi:hypothetical protein